MTEYATLTDKNTVCFERLLPGPLERVWSYITVSEKRAKWFAAGEMDLRVGGTVKLVFNNSGLSPRYEAAPPERADKECGGSAHESTITALEIPHLLTMTFGGSGPDASEVTFELTEKGKGVLLTLTHRRIPNREQVVGYSGGWHTHLEIMEAVLNGEVPPPFWSTWKRINEHYESVA